MFLGLALLEIVFFTIFLILLVIGASLDRRGNESPKWWILGVGFILVAAWFWNDFTFFGPAEVAAVMDGTKVVSEAQTRVVLWDLVSSWSFWTPFWMFLGAGLVYSILEFVLEVRRTARKYTEVWSRHLDRRVEVKQLDAEGKPRSEEGKRGNQWITKTLSIREIMANRDDKSNDAIAGELLESFVNDDRSRYGFVGLVVNEAGTAPEPKINKIALAESVGAWTFLWPVYAVSLIIGDLLTEIFNWIADTLVAMSGRFVRMSFSDVFKF